MEADVAVAGQPPKKRTFKKFNFRGVDLDAHLDMSTGDLVKLFSQKVLFTPEKAAIGLKCPLIRPMAVFAIAC